MVTVITPSYGPDLPHCVRLNQSILQQEPTVRHRILVTHSDLSSFRFLAGPRTDVDLVEDLLPRGFHRLPRPNGWWVSRWSRLPIRGWLVQQLVKLAAVARSDDDAVIMADSDVVFVRPFARTLIRGPDGADRVYRAPGAIHPGMTRHVTWTENAYELLGFDVGPAPYHDYINFLVCWRPDLVRQLLRRIEEVHGRAWHEVITPLRQFSEYTVYGAQVEQQARGRFWFDPDPHCLPHWESEPIREDQIDAFVARWSPADVAVGIQSHSHTAPSVIEEIVRRLAVTRDVAR